MAAAKEGVGIAFKRTAAKDSLAQNGSWPILLLMEKGRDGHLVVAMAKRLGRILIHDPAEGKKWVKPNRLASSWTGIYGEVNYLDKQKSSWKRPRFVNPFALFFPAALAALAAASLFLGFYYVSEEGNYLYPTIFFAAYGLCEIGSRHALMRAMKKFDHRWLASAYDADPARFRTNYERYFSFKKGLFPSWIDFVEGAIASVSLIALLGVNDPSFFIASGLLALCLLAASMAESRALGKKKRSLEEAEKDLFREKGSVSATKMNALGAINEEAYRLGSLYSYERIILNAAILLLSFLPLLRSGNISLNYFLFNFFALEAVGENLQRLAAFFDAKEERMRDYGYFMEYIGKNGGKK